MVARKTDLVFDFDKTIGRVMIDWDGWQLAMAKVIQEHNPKFEYTLDDRLDAHTNDQIKLVGDNLRQAFWRANSEYEAKYASGFEPNPEMISFIKSSKHNMYVFSSNAKTTLSKAFTEFGIADKFRKVVSRDDVDFIKPDPDGFKYILSKDTSIDKYLFIGDSSSDEGAAKAVGMDFFKVNYF